MPQNPRFSEFIWGHVLHFSTCPADSSCFQELLIKNTGALPAQFVLRQGETSPEFRLNDATVILEEDPPETGLAVDGDAAASSGDAAATSGDAVATPGDAVADADAADVADAADAGEVVCIKMNEVGAM